MAWTLLLAFLGRTVVPVVDISGYPAPLVVERLEYHYCRNDTVNWVGRRKGTKFTDQVSYRVVVSASRPLQVRSERNSTSELSFLLFGLETLFLQDGVLGSEKTS